MNILTVNLLFSTFVFWVAARIYISPKLAGLSPQTLLLPILLLHAFRHLGLMFLASGATYAGIPPKFAYPAAFGDLLAALLALVAILGLVRKAASARLLVWIFNVEGTLDLFNAMLIFAANLNPSFPKTTPSTSFGSSDNSPSNSSLAAGSATVWVFARSGAFCCGQAANDPTGVSHAINVKSPK